MLQRHFNASDITKNRNKVHQMLNIINVYLFHCKYRDSSLRFLFINGTELIKLFIHYNNLVNIQ